MSESNNGLAINNEPKYPRINTRRQAYIGLLKNWDENTIDTIKEIKALALNDKNDVICEISFSVKHKTLLQNVLNALKVAKDRKAAKVILGENQPFKHVNPDSNEKTLAEQFWAFSKELDMPIKDQLVVSENSFYSYAENGFPKSNSVLAL